MTPQVISLSALGSTAWIPVDYKQNPFNINIACVVSDTPNLTYKVEYTLDDVFNTAITPTAFSHSTIYNKTTDFNDSQQTPIRGIRLTTTAWVSGTVTMTALQGSVNNLQYQLSDTNIKTVFQNGLPFILFAGDGASVGLTFTGSAGAFTTSAAILSLAAPNGYTYLPANAGGSGNPAGWFYFTMSSTTAGIIYADMYDPDTKIRPTIPTTPTPFSGSPSGRITQVITEITCMKKTVVTNTIGPNGLLRFLLTAMSNTTAGTKTVRVKAAGTTVWSNAWTSSSNHSMFEIVMQNTGVTTKQLSPRISSYLNTTSSSGTPSLTTITEGTEFDITITMQLSVNTEFFVIYPHQITAIYGD